MNRSTMISSFALVAALAVGGGLPAQSFAGESRMAAAGERQWLSIPQVYRKLEAAGYRDIEKIERERGGYEARATDRNGERIRLYINPQSGELMDQRAGKRARDGGDRHQRDTADCNKRRCRDDLPQSTAKPVPAIK